MTSKAADTIYNQLMSNDARSIMQGVEASKEVKLIYDGKIYTALLLRASRQGLVAAQKTLGEYYEKMDNLAKARHWYGKAAAQGSNRAAKNYKKLFR